MGSKQPVRDVGEPLLLTYEEARLKIGISISQLYRLMKSGEIIPLKLAPHVRRIALADCEAYVKRLLAEHQGAHGADAA
jgi:predicted DNA-binding transcriptional regulator AlpA